MSSFGCEEQNWPNIDVLIRDAAGYKHEKQFSREMSWLLGAVASVGPIRFSDAAIDAHLGWKLEFDAATREWILSCDTTR